MKNGKYSSNKWRLPGKRQIAIIASIALLLVGMVGGTIAWLMTSTKDVENVFAPAAVPPTINEDFKGSVKKDVTITNDGNITAYIRAAIIVNWVDTKGNIVADPEGHAYIGAVGGPDWFEKDGYYYYKNPVEPKATTSVLIQSIEPISGSDYALEVDIAAQTIQSVPTSVVAEKWGVTVADDGTISK